VQEWRLSWCSAGVGVGVGLVLVLGLDLEHVEVSQSGIFGWHSLMELASSTFYGEPNRGVIHEGAYTYQEPRVDSP
jgi:hypothetical protein